jgi:hypothetical protein
MDILSADRGTKHENGREPRGKLHYTEFMQFGSPEEAERPPLEAATKQQLVKTECCSYSNLWSV